MGTPGQIVEEKLRSGLAGRVNQFGLSGWHQDGARVLRAGSWNAA